MDKFGSITNITNRRSSRYKSNLNTSSDFNSYLNNSLNSDSKLSQRSDLSSCIENKNKKIDILPSITIMPEHQINNSNMVNVTNNSSDSHNNK